MTTAEETLAKIDIIMGEGTPPMTIRDERLPKIKVALEEYKQPRLIASAKERLKAAKAQADSALEDLKLAAPEEFGYSEIVFGVGNRRYVRDSVMREFPDPEDNWISSSMNC